MGHVDLVSNFASIVKPKNAPMAVDLSGHLPGSISTSIIFRANNYIEVLVRGWTKNNLGHFIYQALSLRKGRQTSRSSNKLSDKALIIYSSLQ